MPVYKPYLLKWQNDVIPPQHLYTCHVLHMLMEKTAVRIVRCKRCGHRWATKLLHPTTCANPKCRSPYWDKERRDMNEDIQKGNDVRQ